MPHIMLPKHSILLVGVLLLLSACQQATPRSTVARQLSESERLQLSRTCADEAEKFMRRKRQMGDEFISTLPYVSHYNTQQRKCFVMVSTTWVTDTPFRNHRLDIVHDAIEGWEVAKLETLTWFDMPLTANAPMHEVFKVGGAEVPASSPQLLGYRALMTQ